MNKYLASLYWLLITVFSVVQFALPVAFDAPEAMVHTTMAMHNEYDWYDRHEPTPNDDGGHVYVNEKSFDMNRIDMTSKVGEVEEWLLINNSHMDHPFHLHGTQFEIIEHINNGVKTPPAYRARKDIVNLRPNEQVRIKTVQHSKGLRMFHCHILEHESVGMMAQLMVI